MFSRLVLYLCHSFAHDNPSHIYRRRFPADEYKSLRSYRVMIDIYLPLQARDCLEGYSQVFSIQNAAVVSQVVTSLACVSRPESFLRKGRKYRDHSTALHCPLHSFKHHVQLTSCCGTVKISFASSYEHFSSRHSLSTLPVFSSSNSWFARRVRCRKTLALGLLKNISCRRRNKKSSCKVTD